MHEASTEATPEVWRRPRAELEADLGSAVSRSLKLRELSSAAPPPPPPLVSSLAAPAPLYLNKAELFGPTQQHFPLNSFLPGRGARGAGAGSLGAGRGEGAGSMFASTESLTQPDLSTRSGAARKIRFNPYNEFSD